MTHRPYKFIVHAVVQQVDNDGTVTGEASVEPVTVFGCDALKQWADDFTDRLAEAGQPSVTA